MRLPFALICLALVQGISTPLAVARPADWLSRGLGVPAAAISSRETVSAQDLVRLRDLGGLSLSPDGRWLSFSVRQASFATDDYVVRRFIVRADGSAPPKPLDPPGAQPITAYMLGLSAGAAAIRPDPAKWSPRGDAVAFRRRVGDRIELWVAKPAGGSRRRVADGSSQVVAFGWDPKGALIYRTGLNTSRFAAAVAAEAAHGWLLDQRMVLWAARAPSPVAPACDDVPADAACDTQTLVVTPAGRRIATPDEMAWLTRDQVASRRVEPWAGPGVGVVSETASEGRWAWTEVANPAEALAAEPVRRVRSTEGACAAADCFGQKILELGAGRFGKSIWFLKRVSSREAGAEDRRVLDRTGLYEWRPSSGEVRELLRTDDQIQDCHAAAARIVCRRSGATQPERIVSISLDDGGSEVLLDPNPDFAAKALPRVRKVFLDTQEGDQGFGRLVYPNDYQPDRAYPLVIVSYRSQGFLRGGAPGDECPIFPLAAAGFFVLSVDLPENLRAQRSKMFAELDRIDRDGQRGVRDAVGSIEREVDALIAEGLVDRTKVAITGLSYGAMTVHYALQHSGRYAAAIASQGATDLTYFAQFPEGPRRDRWMELWNATSILPRPGDDLLRSAWSQQPSNLRAPLLLNLGQDEALSGFEGFAALKFAGRPLEVRVFPSEGHTKYHPSTFSGVYENNLMWLKFWLQGAESPDARFEAQYQRWRAMRDRLKAENDRAAATH